MTQPVVKTCLNCRTDLESTNNGTQCIKCQKNEQKYGKPTTCKFCQLNAAFLERKCVWCSYSERKYGPPVQCASCKLICASQKSEKAKRSNAKVLCRLCVMQARKNNQTVMAGVPVPPEKDESHRSGGHRQHSSASGSASRRHRKRDRVGGVATSSADELPSKHQRAGELSSSSAAAESMAERENELKIQKLNDEISRLTSVIQTKDAQLMEKDKIINNLKAENYNQEKKHRERVQQLIKEKEESIRMIENIRAGRKEKKADKPILKEKPASTTASN
ncbi:unnamed protein product [Caenorhabditis bovis]|uniref:Protein FAM76A n=1 Tax=Caenorhabditis bovis TaxID=2654633 RepID=A0A8S1F7D0_9PELO|nr:unnamed protein product [Caenorhabditis bovis]